MSGVALWGLILMRRLALKHTLAPIGVSLASRRPLTVGAGLLAPCDPPVTWRFFKMATVLA